MKSVVVLASAIALLLTVPARTQEIRQEEAQDKVFGWMKTVALLLKTRHRGVRRVGWLFTLAAALYNLVRIRNVMTAAATG